MFEKSVCHRGTLVFEYVTTQNKPNAIVVEAVKYYK